MHSFVNKNRLTSEINQYKMVSRPKSRRKPVENGPKSMIFQVKKAILTVAKKAGNGYNINFWLKTEVAMHDPLKEGLKLGIPGMPPANSSISCNAWSIKRRIETILRFRQLTFSRVEVHDPLKEGLKQMQDSQTITGTLELKCMIH